jgi:DNA polymerase elongation subunit (family B)
MLVCCFGYLGYKNARFGKIEAHESVNAFSRDAILTAKEVAERNGYQLVHGIIDCIWLKKQGAAERDYLKLCREITAQVGVDISLEGIYDWICFPASKMAPALPTANRYFGWYKHGEFKIRGIEARRHDTPAFLKKMQVAMLDRMSKCRTVEELQASVPDLLEIVRSYVSMLKSGRASPMELVLHRRISQEAEEYANNSISAVVTKMIEDAGIHLAAGESIDFIIIDQSGKKKPEKAKPIGLYAFEDGYDIEKYTELTLKTAETVMLPFGWDYDALKSLFVPDPPKEKKRGSKKKFLRSLAVIGQIELR